MRRKAEAPPASGEMLTQTCAPCSDYNASLLPRGKSLAHRQWGRRSRCWNNARPPSGRIHDDPPENDRVPSYSTHMWICSKNLGKEGNEPLGLVPMYLLPGALIVASILVNNTHKMIGLLHSRELDSAAHALLLVCVGHVSDIMSRVHAAGRRHVAPYNIDPQFRPHGPLSSLPPFARHSNNARRRLSSYTDGLTC